MAFQTPLTIKEVIDKIHKKEYLLPSIQREFVWKPDQVIKLFDSLLKEYPINSFLFWKVQRDNVKEYVFYEFIRTYNEYNNKFTKKADVSGEREITAILDGQQRLTSLYIALKGSYASRKKYGKHEDINSYPEKKLYLNLTKPLDEDNENYELKFLAIGDLRWKTKEYWFPISKILDLYEHSDVNDYINDNLSSIEDLEVKRFASKTLFKLHQVIFTSPLVSYFLEEDSELEKVLNIFIRVNSGGTQLSPADLLFSFANSHWADSNINFRDSVNSLVEELNKIGLGFRIDRPFVMKSLLYLSDVSDISAKVDNFTASNMEKFKDNWENIKKSMQTTFKLVSSLGFNSSNVTSNAIYYPIIYYIFKNNPKNIETNVELESVRNDIRKWIAMASLKRFFSFAPDGALKPIRSILFSNNSNSFPIASIVNHFKGTNRSLVFSKDDIERLISTVKDNSSTFAILSVLYPNLNYRDTFHIDHIFPKAKMTIDNLIENGIDESLHTDYRYEYDRIANLQLLEGTINISKNATDFDIYYSKISDKKSYNEKHYIPELDKYELDSFLQFIEFRKQLLIDKLTDILS